MAIQTNQQPVKNIMDWLISRPLSKNTAENTKDMIKKTSEFSNNNKRTPGIGPERKNDRDTRSPRLKYV